jgi:hypothetical protein
VSKGGLPHRDDAAQVAELGERHNHGRPNGIFVPHVLYHAAARNSIQVHGVGPGGDAVPGPAPHWLRALEGSWER